MNQRLIIFYFTGTGNALAAANWIAETARDRSINVEIRRITPALTVQPAEIAGDTFIGFCYPTHGFNAPPVVIGFLRRLPKSQNRFFVLNTRAGMKMSKIFTPGLSGMAQIIPALILKWKGYKIAGLQPMDLPSNWISVHPGLRQKVVESIFDRCQKKTCHFAEKILSGRKVFKGLWSLPLDLAVSPVSLLYYFYGRFALAKTFVADYRCNNCGLCVRECPVNAIRLKNDRPFWTHKCESCMHCMNACPQRAIQTPHLFVVVSWWVVFSLIPVLVLKYILRFFPSLAGSFDLVLNLIAFITGLPVLFFAYRVYHFLMKFRFFSKLSDFTSLTPMKCWRRYFAPNKYLEPAKKN